MTKSKFNEIVRRLAEAGPLTVETFNPAGGTTTHQVASEPIAHILRQRATIIFADRVKNGEHPQCLTCNIRWSPDVHRNPVRPALITMITVSRFFAEAIDDDLMISSAICARCAEPRDTVHARALDAIRQLWPSMRVTPIGKIGPSTGTKN